MRAVPGGAAMTDTLFWTLAFFLTIGIALVIACIGAAIERRRR